MIGANSHCKDIPKEILGLVHKNVISVLRVIHLLQKVHRRFDRVPNLGISRVLFERTDNLHYEVASEQRPSLDECMTRCEHKLADVIAQVDQEQVQCSFYCAPEVTLVQL